MTSCSPSTSRLRQLPLRCKRWCYPLSRLQSVPFHAPYYATLPVGADDPRVMLPRCWADVELDALLRGSPLAAESRRACAAVRSDYEMISSSVRKTCDLTLSAVWPTLESYDWAVAMVSSRAFSLTTAGGGTFDALVPLVDMHNHHRPRDATYSIVGEAVEMRMARPAAANAAVHNTYGAKGNAQLLGTYAFTMPLNCEPDGSSTAVREFALPQPPRPAGLAAPLVHVPPTSSPLRVGPRRYALHPLTVTVDAFRAVAHGEWEARAVAGAKKLRAVALEGRALRGARRAIDDELAAYALDDDGAARAMTHVPPPPQGASTHWARRSAVAASLVLSERCTLRFYRLIVSLCLEVLMPAADESDGMCGDDHVSPPGERRRVAARRLRSEVEEASAAVASESERRMARTRSQRSAVRAASRELAAPVALAYVQIRFPMLLKQQ